MTRGRAQAPGIGIKRHCIFRKFKPMLLQHLLINEEETRHKGATRKVEFPSDVRRITTWIFIGWSTGNDRDETRTLGKVASSAHGP